jgi:hypothetical protein
MEEGDNWVLWQLYIKLDILFYMSNRIFALPLKLKTELCDLSPRANYTEQPPLVGEVSDNSRG